MNSADAIRHSKIAAARAVKAARLASWIEVHCPEPLRADCADQDFEALRDMDRAWWQDVADRAGCNPPGSDETVDEIVRLLALRKRWREETPNPLEGLFAG